MKYKTFSEVISSAAKFSKINFNDRLEEYLTGTSKRKEEEEKRKKREEELKKQLKDIENERKIDFILNKQENIYDNNEFERINKTIKLNEELYNKKINKNEDLINNDNENKSEKEEEIKYKKEIMDENFIKGNFINQKVNVLKYNFLQNDNDKNSKPKIIELIKEKNINEYDDENKIEKAPKPMTHALSLNPFIIEKDDIITMNKNNNNNIITLKKEKNNKSLDLENSFENNNNDINLLEEFNKEKKISQKLKNILSKNLSVNKNNYFEKLREEYNNQFYIIQSKQNPYNQAKKILQEKLTPNETKQIKDIEEQIIQTENQIKNLKEEKEKLRIQIIQKQKEISDFNLKKKKEDFENERNLQNEMRSILNKFKLELYKSELKNNNLNKDKSEEYYELIDKKNNLERQIKEKDKNFNSKLNKLNGELLLINKKNDDFKTYIKSFGNMHILNNIENSTTEEIKKLNKQITKNNNKKNNNEKNIINDDEISINLPKKIKSTETHINELDLTYPEKYKENKEYSPIVTKQQFDKDGKIIRLFDTGKKEILFTNGTKKQIYPDGYTLVNYQNGDIKQIIPNYKETYFYNKEQILQVKFSDGTTYIKYKDGKIEAIS